MTPEQFRGEVVSIDDRFAAAALHPEWRWGMFLDSGGWPTALPLLDEESGGETFAEVRSHFGSPGFSMSGRGPFRRLPDGQTSSIPVNRHLI